MTKDECIELLKDQIRHDRITTNELKTICTKYNLDLYEDVLSPMDYNTCDRCEMYWPSEELYWLDFMEEVSKELENGIAQEKVEYCAICEDCVKDLVKKGSKND